MVAHYASGGIGLINVETQSSRVLLDGIHRRGAPVWSRDSEYLFVATTLDGATGVWEVRVREGETRLVARKGERVLGAFWFDTDGERIFFRYDESREADIWMAEVLTRR